MNTFHFIHNFTEVFDKPNANACKVNVDRLSQCGFSRNL